MDSTEFSQLSITKISLSDRRDSDQHQIVLLYIFNLGIQTVQVSCLRIISERSEPSSRIFLNGEQPYPWELLHPQDKMSRHRGAELRRRSGRLGGTSLLSPE